MALGVGVDAGRQEDFLATFELMHRSIIISIRPLSPNTKACFVLQTTFAEVAVARAVAVVCVGAVLPVVGMNRLC